MISWTVSNHDEFKNLWPQFSAGLDRGFAGDKKVQIDIRRPSRNSLSNGKIHAVIGDIQQQASIELEGATIPLSCYNPDVCKAFLVRWFDLDLVEMGEPLRKSGKKVIDPVTGDLIYVRPSTTDFTQKEACKFIEWLHAFGVEHNVTFGDRALTVYSEYRELNE